MTTTSKWPLSRTGAELETAAKEAAALNRRLDAIFKNSEPFAMSRLNSEPAFEFDGTDLAKKAMQIADACQDEYERKCEVEDRAAEVAVGQWK